MAELRLPSLNKVLMTGRLTRDPEVRFTPGGTPVANFSIAVNRRWRDQTGEWREDTSFINVVAWQRLAETCWDTMHKGSAVLVEGRLQQRSWETETGQKRSIVEINAQRVECLDRVRRPGGSEEEEYQGGAPTEGGSDEEDVPF